MKRTKVAFALALAAIAAFSGCGSSSGSGTLKVGVRDDIMGFGYYNETTEKYYGLEIDLSEKLAEKLGYADVEYVTVQPDNRKDTLLNGDVDCLIATYTIAESREENFDFSPAYYNDYSMILVQKSSMLTTLEDLSDKKIGVLEGADGAPALFQKLQEEGIEATGSFVYVTSYSELSQALEEGECDAAVMDGCVAKAYMNDDRMILDLTIQEENYGVATVKDSELSEKMSAAVQKLLDDGTVAELIDKWD